MSTDKPKKMKSVKESVDFVTLPLNIEIPNNIRDFNLGLMFRESLDTDSGMLFVFDNIAKQSFHMTETKIPLDIAFIREDGTIESIKELEPFDENPVSSDGEVLCALEVNRGWFAENNVEVGDEIDIEEGKKDACYHKVKSRDSVWPSEMLDEKCWKGYEKKGMKTMFGKRYPNCVKKEEVQPIEEKKGCNHTDKGEECPVHGMSPCDGPRGGNGGKPGPDKNYVKPMGESIEEAVRVPAKTGNIVDTYFNYRGKYYALKMFFPQVSIPKKSDVQDQVSKVYPGAKLLTFNVSSYEPGQPLLHVEGAAWTRKAGKNKEGGLNEKGRKSYERENPGSDLKAPSKKVGNPRRASFCARMKGMKKKLTSSKTANDPDSRINKSLRAWNC